MKLIVLVTSTLFSYAGWYLAEPLGVMWAFALSGVAALIGVYVGWKAATHFGI